LLLGLELGSDDMLGRLLGWDDGTSLGFLPLEIYLRLGSDEGIELGMLLGSEDGFLLGILEGFFYGYLVGCFDGEAEGIHIPHVRGQFVTSLG
jgi:hypothetical protein